MLYQTELLRPSDRVPVPVIVLTLFCNRISVCPRFHCVRSSEIGVLPKILISINVSIEVKASKWKPPKSAPFQTSVSQSSLCLFQFQLCFISTRSAQDGHRCPALFCPNGDHLPCCWALVSQPICLPTASDLI